MNSTKLTSLTFGHIIRFTRELAVIFVLCYLAIKLFSGDLSLNFATLSAVELVSILLAFFSISLSAAFYFAATNSSNKFYDYVNKFNAQSSELLGRLEERIKSVNDKQVEIGDKINLSYLRANGAEGDTELKKNEQQIMELQASMEDAFRDLMARAGVEGEERHRLEKELKEKDEELSMLREEQGKIQEKAISTLKKYITKKIEEYGTEKALSMKPEDLFLKLYPRFVMPARRDLLKCEFISQLQVASKHDITEKGLNFMIDLVLQAAADVS